MPKNNAPFYSWVPRWLGVSVYVFMTVPAMLISGAYTNNAAEMAGSLGIISEHIQYSTFVSAIGMVVFNPFVVSFLRIRRPKMVYMGGLSILFALSYVCVHTTSIVLLMICCFVMGFFRMMILYNTLFGTLEYLAKREATAFLTPEENPTPEAITRQAGMRATLLPPIYLFFMVLGQSGNFFTSIFASEHNWQDVYYLMMGITLTGVLLTFVTMTYQKRNVSFRKLRLEKCWDLATASAALLSFSYIFTYGKTLGWFDHPSIEAATAIFFLSLGLFILQQTNTEKPYLNLKLFARRSVLIGLSIYILGMAASSSSLLVSVFARVSFKLDAYQNAVLGNYASIGFVIGAVTAFVMGRLGMHIKYIFSIGFLFICVSAAYMFFHYQTMSAIDRLIFPTIMRSAGTLILYAMTGILGMSRLTPSTITSWMFMMLLCRSVLGPVVGVSAYANALEERGRYYTMRLSQSVDPINAESASTLARTRKGAMWQGKSFEEGTALASLALKGRVMKQAMLSALKEITGWLVLVTAFCTLFYGIIRYSKQESAGAGLL